MIKEFFEIIKSLIINLFKENLNLFETIKHFSNWDMTLFLTIPLAIIIIFSFFDFIVDAWKIPFFFVVDLIKTNSLENNYYGYSSMVLSAVLFYFLLKNKNLTLSKWMSGVGIVLNMGFLFLEKNYLIMWAIVPFNTLLICIANILD